MTGRTHDLAAFTSLNLLSFNNYPSHLSLATLIVAVGANLIGGLTPDLDLPSSELWHRIPTGTILGKFISPIMGGHRFISHSLVGVIVFGLIAKFILYQASSVLLVDINSIWWAFMIGLLSHLLMDTLTKEGVPWLFPLPIKFGVPPLKLLRIKTGGFFESFIIFPGLLIINGYMFYNFYLIYLGLIKSL